MTDLPDLIAAIRACAVIPPERRLWALAEVAEYSGFGMSTVQARIVCRADFPDAVRALDVGHPRWVAGEVMEWFEGRRKRKGPHQSNRPATSSAEGL